MTAEPRPYRADIDGLRAVAVLSVVAFHLRRSSLAGGFLGVDVFFVISGFLITTILVREIAAHEFSLWRFYERRLRRIGPALLGIMLAVSIASYFILLPVDLLGFARSLLATLAFVSNVYFWRDTDYFSRAAAEKPLLHTWSLGIEEQFYILFPLILWLGFRLRRQWLPGFVAVLTLGSLTASVAALKLGAVLPGFYLLPTRAWELGAGALLVFARRWPNPATANVVAALGLVAIVAGLIVDPAVLPPLLPPAVLPVAGAAALIWAGQGPLPGAGRLLATRGPVLVGQMSYSLYLWHWPILVLVRYMLVRDETWVEDGGLLIAIAAAGYLSWRFVETPFRHRRLVSVRRLFVTCGAAVALLVAVAAAILASRGFPGRLNARAAQINAAVGTNYRCPVSDYLAFGASRACVLAMPSRDPADADVVLLGNSHAQMYGPLVAEILAAHGLHGLLVPANGCLPWTATNIDRPCRQIAATNLAAVASLHRARVVIIAFNWSGLDGDLVDAGGHRVVARALLDRVRPLDATIATLRAAGKRVLVVGPIAEPGWDVASILSRDLAFGRPIERADFIPAANFTRKYGAVIDAFARRRDIGFIRPDGVQCRRSRCAFVLDGRSLFADDNHLAAGSLESFRTAFAPAIVTAAGH